GSGEVQALESRSAADRRLAPALAESKYGLCSYGCERVATRLPPSSCGEFLQDGDWGGGRPSQRGCAAVNAFRNRASASEVSRVVRDWSHCSRSAGRYTTRRPLQ